MIIVGGVALSYIDDANESNFCDTEMKVVLRANTTAYKAYKGKVFVNCLLHFVPLPPDLV